MKVFSFNSNIDWRQPKSVATICTSQTASPLPSTLVINAGATADMTANGACTGVYNYVVGAADDAVVDYGARV